MSCVGVYITVPQYLSIFGQFDVSKRECIIDVGLLSHDRGIHDVVRVIGMPQTKRSRLLAKLLWGW